MSETKLMTPLFHNGNFNREGVKMRVELWREVSNGTDTYRIWKSAGKPEVTYPNAENDTHYLRVERNGYLAPLGRTEFRLINDCGFLAACRKLYSSYDNRKEYIQNARAESEQALTDLLEKENEEIQRLGTSPECQADFIKEWLGEMVERYLKSKTNGGESPPDFIGALELNELEQCKELSAAYKKNYECRQRELREKERQERERHGLEQNAKSEALVLEAEKQLVEGGAIPNAVVTFYQSDRGSTRTSLFCHLMKKHGINVPLRTLGWINNNLTGVTVYAGGMLQVTYQRPAKSRSKGSERAYQCLRELIDAVEKSSSGEKSAEERK